MAKSTNKTKPTGKSVDAFLDAVPTEGRRDDARELITLMKRLTREEPYMWGPSIVGFGNCHYRYASGREGDMPRAAFSPRKTSLVIYLMGVFEANPELMARLGTHTTGKGCLYVKRLDDIDRRVLEEIIKAGMAYAKKTYG